MQALGTKVGECAEVVPLLFDAYFEGDHEQVILYSERLSQLEYEADQLKIEARDHLPRSLFMPVDRRDSTPHHARLHRREFSSSHVVSSWLSQPQARYPGIVIDTDT